MASTTKRASGCRIFFASGRRIRGGYSYTRSCRSLTDFAGVSCLTSKRFKRRETDFDGSPITRANVSVSTLSMPANAPRLKASAIAIILSKAG